MFELPNPTIEDIRVNRDAVRTGASLYLFSDIQNQIRQIAEALSPASITRIAQNRFPETRNPVDQLKGELQGLLASIEEFAEKLADIKRAEDARLGPVIRAATKRLFEVADLADKQDRMIARVGADHAARCKKLGEAGLSSEEIGKLAPAPDIQAMEEECTALRAEFRAMELFIKTRDESALPAGFVKSSAQQEVDGQQAA